MSTELETFLSPNVASLENVCVQLEAIYVFFKPIYLVM